MKRIQVLVILVGILLTYSLQLSAQKNRHDASATITVDEVISNFRQYLEDIPYFN